MAFLPISVLIKQLWKLFLYFSGTYPNLVLFAQNDFQFIIKDYDFLFSKIFD